MNRFSKYGIVVSLAFAVTPYANAGLIEGQLFNTGLDSSGNLITGEIPDANWSWSTDANSGDGIAYKHPAYVNNSDYSQWISVDSKGANNNLDFRNSVFQTTFDLTGYDAGTASISGLWGVDNSATMYLNGNDTGNTLEFGPAAFNALTGFSISDGFVGGLNTLSVYLTNGYPDLSKDNIGPLGLRFDNMELSAVKVPEPGTLALVALGLAGLILSRRRKV